MRIAPDPDLLFISIEDLSHLTDDEFRVLWTSLGVLARKSALAHAETLREKAREDAA